MTVFTVTQILDSTHYESAFLDHRLIPRIVIAHGSCFDDSRRDPDMTAGYDEIPTLVV